ncbi:MAG: 30S ribosomal protein S20 [Anaerolineales bacterium]|nr:30S ribosomal protein S20 [Anaerolineales bacterium]MDP7643572.1 30S ribosomal protein S20 [Anaerolineales bacterium]HJL70370.1 30S ribosomal protein S20 [Anaerolineales bacterium]HJN41664.1 30S ribosomal protein S20 [Anaerolineales bacterium]
MANIKSAQKRIRSDAKKTERNRRRKAQVQTAVRRAREALAGKQAEAARVEVLNAASKLDRAAENGVIHRNNASRRKGSLMRSLAALEAED